MARQPRFQYLGALYHVMARGNGGDAVFVTDDGRIDEDATKAIRRGWYLGKDSFRDKLLKMLGKPPGRRSGGSRRADGAERDRGEKEALRILREGGGLLGLPVSIADLAALRKSDSRKVQLAILLRTHTSVSNEWIAQKLAMGHPGSVSRSVSDGRADNTMGKSIKKMEGRNVNQCTLTPFIALR